MEPEIETTRDNALFPIPSIDAAILVPKKLPPKDKYDYPNPLEALKVQHAPRYKSGDAQTNPLKSQQWTRDNWIPSKISSRIARSMPRFVISTRLSLKSMSKIQWIGIKGDQSNLTNGTRVTSQKSIGTTHSCRPFVASASNSSNVTFRFLHCIPILQHMAGKFFRPA